MAKEMIKPMINTLLLLRLDEYCKRKGLGRDLVLAVALDQFLDSADADDREAALQ